MLPTADPSPIAWYTIPHSTGNGGYRGVPSTANYPPFYHEGTGVSIDSHGDLYFLGGFCRTDESCGSVLSENNRYNDFWKLIVSTNSFVWLSGSLYAKTGVGVYGAKGKIVSRKSFNCRSGVPSASNVMEVGSSWMTFDSSDRLFAYDYFGYMWMQDTRGSCSGSPCASGSACINTVTDFICSSFIVPNSFSIAQGPTFPANFTAGVGDTVKFLLQVHGGVVSSVSFGSPTLGNQRFTCSSFIVTAINVNVSQVSCTLGMGAGNNLNFALNMCVPPYGCYPVFHTGSTRMGYKLPLILSSSLCYASSPAVTTSALGAFNNLPASVSFQGANFVNDSTLTQVWYGPDSNPRQFACALDVPHSSATRITCASAAAASGLGLRFTASVGGQVTRGLDTFNYPTQGPSVASVRGSLCVNANNEASDCPTLGSFPITISGQRLYEPITVLVSGADCPIIRPSNATTVRCTLPSGTGASVPLAVISAGFFSPLSRLLSYSPPRITAISSSACSQSSAIILTDCPRAGYVQLTLNGTSFGDTGAIVFIGTVQCLPLHHDVKRPQFAIFCTLPPSRNSNQPVQVIQKNGQLSTNPATISYVQCSAGTYDNGTGCVTCK